MTDLAELERRVSVLETAQIDNTRTLNWVVGTIGRMAADISVVKEDVRVVRSDIDRLRLEFNEFRREFPAIVAETMREVLRGERE